MLVKGTFLKTGQGLGCHSVGNCKLSMCEALVQSSALCKPGVVGYARKPSALADQAGGKKFQVTLV